MHESILTTAARLSDEALDTSLKTLASNERESTVELVAHLAEFDHRKVYLAQGHGSLFRYCTVALRLSEDAACHRIVAARTVRKFPVIVDLGLAARLRWRTSPSAVEHTTSMSPCSSLVPASRLGWARRRRSTLFPGEFHPFRNG